MDKEQSLKNIRPFTKPPLQDYANFIVPELPLDIEIGCGVGLHPILYQAKHPKRFLVALEHTKEKFDKFHRRYVNHDSPSNLLPVHANGISWVSQQLAINSVDQFFFLYPNPNPKAGDLNKRWYAMPFMQRVLEVLKPGGRITLATNELFYKDEAIEYFVNYWKLKLIEETQLDSEFKARTHFEKKYLERGEACFNLVFSN